MPAPCSSSACTYFSGLSRIVTAWHRASSLIYAYIYRILQVRDILSTLRELLRFHLPGYRLSAHVAVSADGTVPDSAS